MVIALAVLASPAWGGGLLIGSGVVASSCNLLSDGFEAADGTNSDTYGWTDRSGNPEDYIEIDTSQYHSGSSSMYFNDAVNSTQYIISKAISKQSSGKFTVSFWVRFESVSDETRVLTMVDGSSGDVISIRKTSNDLGTYSAGWKTVASDVFVANTWYKIEIEANMDTNTFNVWVGDGTTQTEYNNGGSYWALQNNYDPDLVTLAKTANTLASSNHWVDDLCIYSGQRIP